jgi:hypothetical protein
MNPLKDGGEIMTEWTNGSVRVVYLPNRSRLRFYFGKNVP